MMTKNTAIILVNWNGKELTLSCLASLKKLKGQDNPLIIVVDNNSSDDSVSAIQKQFPDISIIQNERNVGFTGGNNRGIEYALGRGVEFIWLLNNDTVVHPDAFRSLLSAFNDEIVGIAGSKIYFAPGYEFHKNSYTKSERGHVLWYAGGKIDWNNVYGSHRGVDEVDKGQYDMTEETEFITGCSMMVRRKVFEKIGTFDEKYYLYLEDLDFSVRARKAGFRLLYVPASVIWHKNAGSTARPGHSLHEYYFTRNRLLLGKKFASFRTKAALVREAGKFLIRGSAVKRRAVFDALLCRFGDRYTWKGNP